jgi:hypothetical protein
MDGKMGSSAPGHGLSIENAIGSPANLGKKNRQPAVLFAHRGYQPTPVSISYRQRN